MSKRLIALMMIVMMILVACETGDQASDALSAQNQQPALVGFETTDLDVASDAMIASAGAASLASGNVALTAGLQRADALLQCLQDTGSVSGLVYIEENPGIVPQFGASLVVNKTRVQRNVFACLTDPGFSAQTAIDIEPCASYGEFTVDGEEFWFAYVGLGSGVCAGFETHYASLNATTLGEYMAPLP
ncbi:MAG: hypothetical protein ACFE0Q_13015 [Anaerolineae bacterium]